MSAGERDEAARRRDDDAAVRDGEGNRDAHDTADRHWRLRAQILDHFTRLENIELNPNEWADLTPAAFDRLHTLVVEQRHLAMREREAIITGLDELDEETHGSRMGRVAASDDRHAAGRDRRSSACDRDDSAGDRDLSARDRGQAAIEREELDPAELNRLEHGSAVERAEHEDQTVAETRRRVAESRARIDRFLGTRRSPPRHPPNPPSRDDD